MTDILYKTNKYKCKNHGIQPVFLALCEANYCCKCIAEALDRIGVEKVENIYESFVDSKETI